MKLEQDISLVEALARLDNIDAQASVVFSGKEIGQLLRNIVLDLSPLQSDARDSNRPWLVHVGLNSDGAFRFLYCGTLYTAAEETRKAISGFFSVASGERDAIRLMIWDEAGPALRLDDFLLLARDMEQPPRITWVVRFGEAPGRNPVEAAAEFWEERTLPGPAASPGKEEGEGGD